MFVMQRIESSDVQIQISEWGAELQSIYSKPNQIELLWQGDARYWNRRAPVLFPIVGRLKNQTYIFNNIKYQLPQHGFARDLKFNVTAQSTSSIEYTLESNAQTLAVFPFSFRFSIGYTLNQQVLTTRFSILNTGHNTMLYSFGAHPAFNCPLLPDTRPDAYAIKFYNTKLEHTLLAEGLRTSIQLPLQLQNGVLQLHHTLFDNDALVFENNQITAVSLLYNHKPLLTLNCGNWPYFGIWSKPSAPFICFEPWHGVTDHTETNMQWLSKTGLLQLLPNTAYSAEFTLDFKGVTQYNE